MTVVVAMAAMFITGLGTFMGMAEGRRSWSAWRCSAR
jgi:hypothetical protein